MRPWDRVAVLGSNRPAFLAATIGCLRAGVVAVPLDIQLPAAAIADRLADADPALVLADPDLADVVATVPRRVEVMDETWPAGDPVRELQPWPQTRAMHYTSGTTGRSKGVYAGRLGPDGGRALAEEERQIWGFTDQDVHLVCGPLHHSGPHRFALNSLLFGGRVVLPERFDAAAVLGAIAEHRVTTSFMVPTHLSRLLAHATEGADLSSVRWIAHAGAPCPPALKRRAMDAFPAGSMHEFYGSTEGQFTVITPDEWLQRPGSVGRARAGRSLAVLGEAGDEVPAGAVGTVFTSAPPFARFEYWRDPARTSAAWRGDRFTVDDLGRVDADGFLYLAGRRGDLVITGGVNVYPAEVERELLAHPAVDEAAVFGVADEEWGERVCAAVVTAPGAHLDAPQLRAWARTRLSGPQTPKELVVVDALPKTGSGKIVRAGLALLLGAQESPPTWSK